MVTAIGHQNSDTQIHKKKEEKERRKAKKVFLPLSLKVNRGFKIDLW